MHGDNDAKALGGRTGPFWSEKIDLPGDVGRLHVDMKYEPKAAVHTAIEREAPRTGVRKYSYPQAEEISPTNWRYHKANLLALVEKVLEGAGVLSEDLTEMRAALRIAVDASGLRNLLSHWKTEEKGSLLSSYLLSPSEHAGTLTWLHLSDLHCKGKKGKDDYDRAAVVEELWKDIQGRDHRINECLRELDCIFITGDLAFYGTGAEYRFIEKEEVLPKLFAATGLDEARLFIVPGNHDICQKKVPDAAKGAKEKLLNDSKDRSTPIANALKRAEERKVYFQRLDAYRQFFTRVFDRIELDVEGYFYVKPLHLPSGITIAIIGLNSAWSSYGGDADRNQLMLGEYQVKKAIGKAKDANADLLIVLCHHPLDWLADNHDRYQVQLLLQTHCHFVLNGHRHRNQAYQQNALLHILAGASFEDRYKPTLNSYDYVRLNLDNGEGRIYFRRYSDERGEWVADNDVPGTDAGVKSFILNR